MLHSSQSAPVVDGKVMEFVIFAIESAARKLDIPAPNLYNRLEKLNLIRQYLISGYDMLHTQSREYIADTLVEALENWEAYYKEKGEPVWKSIMRFEQPNNQLCILNQRLIDDCLSFKEYIVICI